jgi:hypothetical protein
MATPDPVQPESRLLVKQLMNHNTTVTHKKCDEWVEHKTAGKYRSMLALVEGDPADVEYRRQVLTELTAILRDGDLIKLEEVA